MKKEKEKVVREIGKKFSADNEKYERGSLKSITNQFKNSINSMG